MTHHGWLDLIGLGADGGRGPLGSGARAVEVLDAALVVLAEPQRVGEAVEGGHDGAGHQRVLQTQHMAQLMGRHLQQVCAWGGRGWTGAIRLGMSSRGWPCRGYWTIETMATIPTHNTAGNIFS